VDGENVSERILHDGYAVQVTYPPNVRYVDVLRSAQRGAREAGRGLWGGCPGA
jgi:micrococcal nuclease